MNFEPRDNDNFQSENSIMSIFSDPLLSPRMFQELLNGRSHHEDSEEVTMTSTARCIRSPMEGMPLVQGSQLNQRFLGSNEMNIFFNLQQSNRPSKLYSLNTLDLNQPRMMESFFSLMEQLNSNPEEEPQQGLPKEMIDKIKRMKMGKSCQDCTVCSDGFKKGEKIRKLPCKHIFHDKCILPWFEHKSTCPNCRFNLLEYYQENSDVDY